MKPLQTWVPVPENSDFTIYNLPFGIFSVAGDAPRAGIAIGDQIIDLAVLADAGLIAPEKDYFTQPTLNRFIGLGKKVTNEVRLQVQRLLIDEDSELKKNPRFLVPQSEATMHLPIKIGDYTDFYSSLEHATNVGKMFRDPENALLPNWKHIPVGYHGRASSVVVSGTPIHRPKGQVMPKGAASPVFKPTGRLDFELEMAFVVGRNSDLGESVPVSRAEEYIFGMVLFNDWSARDIQKWEYVPLGPFLGKSFASSMSPWIVTMEALEPFRVKGPDQDPEVLPYLRTEGPKNYDIDLSVGIRPQNGEEEVLCRSNFKYMYWNMAQQLAHHTINGCNICVGDVMASGTISGKDETSYGSMLELSWGGQKTIDLKNGATRTFIEDNDTITMRGSAKKGDVSIGFGEVSGKILPAK
ncbi:fumarylacetoacetase [Maribacter sp. MMG018]|uniref:fumarylacetoacetase n=1 Tax=Maribacter sp. MMG018 TaxID=2822688 RepID=UPI001B38C3C8|nr:fumarylacetoacetase [Maribacter sp. MMG018]MBQ4915961.1 fumarylacetoacetase [Maribacter sp. MMG018]